MAVRVEKVGNRIHLVSQSPTPGLKAGIPGANYSGAKRTWTMPLNLETCHLLRERFGQQLQIGPQLWVWAKEENARRSGAASLAKQMDATLRRVPDVAPKLAAAMDSRTYQRVAARYIADGKHVLIGDTVGLGKTVEALAGVVESGVAGPYLVVCPKTAVEVVWRPEIERWLPGATVVTLPEGRAKREAVLDELITACSAPEGSEVRAAYRPESTWVVVHPEAVRTKSFWVCSECGDRTACTAKPMQELDCGHPKSRSTPRVNEHTFPQLFKAGWGAIVADESDRSIIRLKGTPNQTRNGMEILRDEGMRPEGLRIAMSGTPFRSRPHLLWSTLNWLNPKAYPSFWNWAKLYWEMGGYTGWQLGAFRADREELLWKSLDGILLRRTRKEVRAELPDRNLIDNGRLPGVPGVWLDMEPAQEKAYHQMRDLAVASIEGGDLQAVGVLAELTRLKQFSVVSGRLDDSGTFRPHVPSNKFNYCVDLLRQLGFPDAPETKVVIASQFTQVLESFAEWFAKELPGVRIGMITGNTPAARRPEIVAEFEDTNSKMSLMLLNTKAGGSAITLDAADEMVILDETWVADDQEQLEGRIDNRNPERKIKPRNYRYLRSLGTVEESIAMSNMERKEQGHRLLDGRRGLAFAMKVVAHEKERK